MNRVWDYVPTIIVCTLVFGVGFGLGLNFSKPMSVLENWRTAYKQVNLEKLRCEQKLIDMETKYLESTVGGK